jgi:hypothetical protein
VSEGVGQYGVEWVQVEATQTLTCVKCGALVADNEDARALHLQWHRVEVRLLAAAAEGPEAFRP